MTSGTKPARKSRLGRWVVLIGLPAMLIAGIIYFNVQTLTGQYGTLQRDDIAASHNALEREITQLERTVEARKARNRGLRAGSVDLDLLDERARQELGMIRTDEVFLVDN